MNRLSGNVRNADISWGRFDPDVYHDRNYSRLLPEDRQILHVASRFLVKQFGRRPPAENAVDVGAGSNLYPALLMLPWARRITLTDHAQSNVEWLSQNVVPVYDTSRPWEWQRFWDELAALPGYREISFPRDDLAARQCIEQWSIFDLPSRRWDLGSMFFVADGITDEMDEFDLAVRSFLDALRPGSPFVAAFMVGSKGYTVAHQRFPAVSVSRRLLEAKFAELPVSDVTVTPMDRTDDVVRSGYDGMVLVTGQVA